MLYQVCLKSEPVLRLSSIRRGDLFIIQIIQAFKRHSSPPPNYQCISRDLVVIWFIQKKSNNWRHSPQELAGKHLHRFCNQGGTWWLMFCLQNTQMTAQVLLLINIETFTEHFVWTGFLNVSIYRDSPINEEGYKPCSPRWCFLADCSSSVAEPLIKLRVESEY